MHIAHLFDRYLNTTMNWAYHLIQGMPGVKTTIAAPLILDNGFFDSAFHYLYNPFQWQRKSDEWSISPLQQRVAQAFFQFIPLYQAYLGRKWWYDRPDILHAHFAGVAWQYFHLAKRLDIPLVISFYGYDYEQLPFRKPGYLKRYRELFDYASAILSEGPHGKAILTRQGCPPEKIHIVPLGISLEEIPFHLRKKESGQLHLVQAATFTEKKGHRFTLEAFLAALHSCPKLHLTLVGEARNPEIAEQVRQFIRQHKLEDRIALQDFVPFDRFHDWLKHFDVFIQPSCYAADRDCEGGAPIVLLDAQATGMPVIATTHCDIPGEVIHKRTGLLAPEKDILQLAQHIRTFCEMDEKTYLEYSESARQHVETHFDIQKSRRQLLQLYQTLLKN